MLNAENVYPLARPSGRLSKVTHPLIAAVAATLAEHGFPQPVGTRDLARLYRALDRFAHGPADEPAAASGTPQMTGMDAMPR
ncbi:hypothetical protein [Amycolatopsis australiensis]|uniref:Uncharacterized protein n=1 Tax=Amycolatopsis australiensis TaxID=546364 RepID=A0A1K1LL75_9PSEU|nr:hypothetical protein [Amycolatopsis australiensis]SFW11603.1 hypothetical protein SAMN04489730_0038 [Amycolatopsis australiensis]